MNSMVSRLLTVITGRLSPRILKCTHGLKQANKQTNKHTIKMIRVL